MMVYMKQNHHLINSEKAVLQLIDIENLCGGSCQVRKFHSHVKEVVDYKLGDDMKILVKKYISDNLW